QIDDRMARLLKDYPTHARAADAQLVEARQLEAAKEWQKAADAYLQIRPESSAYPEAQLRAGNCLYQESRRLAKAGDTAGATAACNKAVQVLSGLGDIVKK